MTLDVNGYELRLEADLQAIEQRIVAASLGKPMIDLHKTWNKGGVPWGIVGEFARDREVALTAADFAKGTIRVMVPCKLVLCESIAFNPNAPTHLTDSTDPSREVAIDPNRELDWFPTSDQAAYFKVGEASHPGTAGLPGATPTQAYRLGFFAAITVEHGEGTIIDLNGFRLACHPQFAMQQRFHALIELANQPFIPGQGPAQFGRELRPARLAWIRNGEMGRSSHHGIHGNGMHDILISDVTFRDYEVAAISLNGGRRIVIRDCQLEGTSTDVPVLGSYSAGRFVRLIARSRLAIAKEWLTDTANATSPDKADVEALTSALETALGPLNEAMNTMFNAVHFPASGAVAPALFNNSTGLADGNPYGIAIHARGVLVNAFLCNGPTLAQANDAARAFECTDVTLRRVNIAHTRGAVREVLALAIQPNNAVVTDAAGSAFRFFGHDSALNGHSDAQPAEMDDDGNPTLTEVGRAQIAIAALERKLVDLEQISSAIAVQIIPPQLVAWANTPNWRILKAGGKDYRIEPDQSIRFRVLGNGDSMFHVNKGAIGLFVQGVDGLTLDRVSVSNVANLGLPGSTKPGRYKGPDDGGHPNQGWQTGYTGADARGIYVGACSNVTAADISASAVDSRYGSAWGVSIAGGSANVDSDGILIGDVSAGSDYQAKTAQQPRDRLPNTPPEAIGLYVDRFSTDVGICGLHLMGRVASVLPKDGVGIRIESPTTDVES
jgi:hypothetical protein